MGRSPCCSKEGLNRGAWTAHEDKILADYIKTHGEGRWRNLPKRAGLKRCGKSCRLRWLNYLRPDIKRGNISADEEELIIRLHRLLGNRWSLIAGRLPGRTDNEIKNYWNTNLAKKVHQNSTPTTLKNNKSNEKVVKKRDETTQLAPTTNTLSHPSERIKETKPSILEDYRPINQTSALTSINGLSLSENDDYNMSEFMFGFNMEEFYLSDLDLSLLGDVNYCNALSPSRHHTLISSEKMLEQDWSCGHYAQQNVGSNLRSLTPFLDNGEEWLAE